MVECAAAGRAACFLFSSSTDSLSAVVCGAQLSNVVAVRLRSRIWLLPSLSHTTPRPISIWSAVYPLDHHISDKREEVTENHYATAQRRPRSSQG